MNTPPAFTLIAFALGLVFGMTPGPRASANSLIYDHAQNFTDPTLEIPQSCDLCMDVYRMRRPIMPLVNHVFVGTRLRTRCEGVERKSLQIFGAVKNSDLGYLEKVLSENRSDRMRYIGTSCGAAARDAYAEFSRYSRERLAWSRNPIKGIPRFVATPILGRPCAMAAQDIIDGFTESYRETKLQSDSLVSKPNSN